MESKMDRRTNEQMDGQTDKRLLQVPSENHKVRTITSKFHQIPPFLQKISCGKHSANQIEAASLNMQGIYRTSNLSEGLTTNYQKQVS
jgi:hypothetical protein